MGVNGIPKTERIWVTINTADGTTYHITVKENDRTYYFLYKIVDNKAVKLGKK